MQDSSRSNSATGSSTTLPPSEPEVVLEAPPTMRAAEEHAGERGHDAPPDGGQARPGRGARGGGGPGWGAVSALFPPEPQVLQEGEGEQAQQRVVVQPAPAPALEVVQPQLVLELLVHLLADPPALDQGGQGLERGVGRQVREVVLALAGGPVLADQPRLV